MINKTSLILRKHTSWSVEDYISIFDPRLPSNSNLVSTLARQHSAWAAPRPERLCALACGGMGEWTREPSRATAWVPMIESVPYPLALPRVNRN